MFSVIYTYVVSDRRRTHQKILEVLIKHKLTLSDRKFIKGDLSQRTRFFLSVFPSIVIYLQERFNTGLEEMQLEICRLYLPFCTCNRLQ